MPCVEHQVFELVAFVHKQMVNAHHLEIHYIILAVFAFLDAELVATGFLLRTQLIDAIAVGQFTSGPVFSSVTFICYQINGFSGALISTIAIFLPSVIFGALLNPLVKIIS